MANLCWESGNKSKRINLQFDKDPQLSPGMLSKWNSLICLEIPTEDFKLKQSDFHITIKLKDSLENVPVEFEYKKPEGKAVEMRYNFAYIEEQLKELGDSIISGKFNKDKAENERDILAGLKEMLNETLRDLFKLKVSERKVMMDASQEVKDYMEKVGELLR